MNTGPLPAKVASSNPAAPTAIGTPVANTAVRRPATRTQASMASAATRYGIPDSSTLPTSAAPPTLCVIAVIIVGRKNASGVRGSRGGREDGEREGAKHDGEEGPRDPPHPAAGQCLAKPRQRAVAAL